MWQDCAITYTYPLLFWHWLAISHTDMGTGKVALPHGGTTILLLHNTCFLSGKSNMLP